MKEAKLPSVTFPAGTKIDVEKVIASLRAHLANIAYRGLQVRPTGRTEDGRIVSKLIVKFDRI